MNICVCQGQGIVGSREGGQNRLGVGIPESGND